MLILAQNVLFVERVRASMARTLALLSIQWGNMEMKRKISEKKTYHTLSTIFGGQEISAQSRGIHKKRTVRYHAQTDKKKILHIPCSMYL